MFVHSNIDAISNAGVKDEIGVFASLLGTSDVLILWSISSFELDQKCLDDMITMHIHY
jgi:hypothetical protein